MIDRYTKIVLTVIAVALSAIAVQGVISSANAQGGACGASTFNPCYMKPSDVMGMPIFGSVTVNNMPLR